MHEMEYFCSLPLVPGAWTILHLDGHALSRFTAPRFHKPFDPRFCDLMVAAARVLLDDLQGLYACIDSDEISVLLVPNWEEGRSAAGERGVRLRRAGQRGLCPPLPTTPGGMMPEATAMMSPHSMSGTVTKLDQSTGRLTVKTESGDLEPHFPP
jgi:hypothetical protein